MIVFLEAQGSNSYNRYAMCPAGHMTWRPAGHVVLVKDVVRRSVKIPEFDKHLKKAGGHISRNVLEITIKMKTIVRKTLMIKINKLRLRNFDN